MVRWGGEKAWAIWKIDLLRFGSRVCTVKRVLNETESHAVYKATIMGFINAFLYPPLEQVNLGYCSGIFMRWFKALMAPNFLHMVPALSWTVSANTLSVQKDALDSETQTDMNFYLSYCQDGLHLSFYDLENGGGSEVIR